MAPNALARADHRRTTVRLSVLSLLVGLTLSPTRAQADAATAEALFRQGKDLMAKKAYAEACPKLAESQRLDPATGTLLALALCYEQAGQTASAWSTYADVVARARIDGNAEREQAARTRAAALEPRLARLTVKVPASVAALSDVEVKRDEVVLGAATFGQALPVDPGVHAVEVRASGKRPWSRRIEVAASGRVVVDVPELGAAPVMALTTPPTPVAAPPPAAVRTVAPVREREGRSSVRLASWITGGAGVLALGLGGVFAAQAVSKNRDSNTNCDGNVCNAQGKSDRDDARASGNTATGALVAGVVLVATGVTLFVVSRPGATVSRWQVGPSLAAGQGGLWMQGSFR